ncbi:hypothetical protein [Candidatus Odyssella thessalonicensis]|uniref:hypothetical protein n=1 Tax=Candidatus Odyssella thessalonicensis TaxID=84647 RepID=UPI000305E849|nr:hypothetical protein [Candidatus Odyssella thessalonicensis]
MARLYQFCRRRKLSLIVVGVLFFYPGSLSAIIHPQVFKEITRHFKRDKEVYSPIIGAVALETGLIENIRFLGAFEPGTFNGERLYYKDTSEEPLWNMVKLLFPSSNGILGTDSQSNTNFGRYVDSPETVALLLNFSYLIRQGRDCDNCFILDYANQIMVTLSARNDRAKNLKKKTLIPLLRYITQAVVAEEGVCLYPPFTPEQILNAFFCHKFSTQAHINLLLSALSEEIVDHSLPFSSTEACLTPNDVQAIMSSSCNLDLDQLFALAHADLFTAITPYRSGMTLLSNGNCRFYNRRQDVFTHKGMTFADCVETAGRHFLNLLLFNPKIHDFDLEPLLSLHAKLTEGDLQRQRLEKVIDFYTYQRLDLVNAGDTHIRSAWNRVVADLNTGEGGDEIRYKQAHNELSSGLINFIRTYQKIFGFKVKQIPDKDSSSYEKNKFLKKALKSYAQLIHPGHDYQIEPQDIVWDEVKQDLVGTIKITISDEGRDLFEFSLFVYPYHSYVGEVVNFKESSLQALIDKIINGRGDILHPKTTEQILWSLFPTYSRQGEAPLLYQVYAHNLGDNHAKIEALYQLVNINSSGLNKNDKLLLMAMLRNMLAGLAWEDKYILERISATVKNLLLDAAVDHDFKSVLLTGVQALALRGDLQDHLLVKKYFRSFTNLKFVRLAQPVKEFTAHHKSLFSPAFQSEALW